MNTKTELRKKINTLNKSISLNELEIKTLETKHKIYIKQNELDVRNYIDVIEEKKGGYFLELDAKKWAKAIQKATKIPEKVLIDNATYITNISSSKIIDAKYFKIFKKLININN